MTKSYGYRALLIFSKVMKLGGKKKSRNGEMEKGQEGEKNGNHKDKERCVEL